MRSDCWAEKKNQCKWLIYENLYAKSFRGGGRFHQITNKNGLFDRTTNLKSINIELWMDFNGHTKELSSKSKESIWQPAIEFITIEWHELLKQHECDEACIKFGSSLLEINPKHM